MMMIYIFQTLYSTLLTFLVAYSMLAFHITFPMTWFSLDQSVSTSTIISISPFPQTFRPKHQLLNTMATPTMSLPDSKYAAQARAGPRLEGVWTPELWHCLGTPPKATYIGSGSALALH
jgi:hypothetical protein